MRVFTDGAEMADILFWDGYTGTLEAVSADPAPAYSAYCYKISGLYSKAWKLISALSECYLRERMYVEFSTHNSGIPIFRYGNTELMYIGLNATGHITAYVTGVGIVATSSSAAIISESWFLLEVYYKIADVGGRIVVYQDGVNVIDYTGDTKYSTYSTFDNISYEPYYSVGNWDEMAVDDLALNDTTGGVDDSWCGDGIIIKVAPDGEGTTNDWHGSDLDDVDNHLMVDEYPNDGNTTYVYQDGSSSGTQDQYTLSDYDGTGKTILRIYPEARARKSAASAHTLKLGTLASGGTDAMSPARNLTTNYSRVVGADQTVNPVDSGGWEEADIDALELILEVG